MYAMRSTLLSLVALLLLAAPAAAGVRPWVSGSFGGSTLAMNDVNEGIQSINRTIASSGMNLGSIHRGYDLGASLGLDLGERLAVGVGYERPLAQSMDENRQTTILVDVPGEIVRGFARVTFGHLYDWRFFAEASGGTVRSAARTTVETVGDPTQRTLYAGHSGMFELAGGLVTKTNSHVSLLASLGWRLAKVKDVTVAGVPVENDSGGRFTVDYSGVFARVGLQVALWPIPKGTAYEPGAGGEL
jgi:hypothetical protein